MGGQINTVIVGAAGYTGAELVWLLSHHPAARVGALFGSAQRADGPPARIGDLFPRLRSVCDLEVRAAGGDAILSTKPDAVLLATPHEASMELVPALRARGARVFDLSGAFRLRDSALYPKYYGFAHTHSDLLGQAVYGLPELNRAAIARADLIAVPGCYPTSAIIPLAPLVRAGAVRRGTRPIVDATSGVSGAGRTPTAKNHFSEVSLQPYNVLKHRHNPEMDQHAGTPVVFTPHLGAYDRGILATIHVELADGFDAARIGRVFADAYSREPFIRLLAPDMWPSIAAVERTNFCDIGWAVDEPNRHLIIASAIDNLTKGAAGQAVQCLNIRFDLPETAGLK